MSKNIRTKHMPPAQVAGTEDQPLPAAPIMDHGQAMAIKMRCTRLAISDAGGGNSSREFTLTSFDGSGNPLDGAVQSANLGAQVASTFYGELQHNALYMVTITPLGEEVAADDGQGQV